MDLIADILLGAGAIGAAVYCMVLSRRLQRLTQLETGMGGAIAVLSTQVDELTRTLGRAETAARTSSDTLEARTRRAEDAVKRLELLISTLHDLPEPARPARTTPEPPVASEVPAAARTEAAPEAAPEAAAGEAGPVAASAPETMPNVQAEPRLRVVRRRARRTGEALTGALA